MYIFSFYSIPLIIIIFLFLLQFNISNRDFHVWMFRQPEKNWQSFSEMRFSNQHHQSSLTFIHVIVLCDLRASERDLRTLVGDLSTRAHGLSLSHFTSFLFFHSLFSYTHIAMFLLDCLERKTTLVTSLLLLLVIFFFRIRNILFLMSSLCYLCIGVQNVLKHK